MTTVTNTKAVQSFIVDFVRCFVGQRPELLDYKLRRYSNSTCKDGRLTHFELLKWDGGKLTVNATFAEVLRQNRMESFDAIWSKTANAEVAKKFRSDRFTLRFELSDGELRRTFYIKRHGRSSWKEYLKPLLRLTWPILGARNEWNAILDFHNVGIPTMVPVAIGESGEHSFLVTEGLEDCTKLSKLEVPSELSVAEIAEWRRRMIRNVANLARRMHAAGLHHQDFYLGHLMRSNSRADLIYTIDLGRVRKQRTLAMRWIVKDLAQLDFSAIASEFERLRFLRWYLGRRLKNSDRTLINAIQAKRQFIARHSRKNKL